MINVICIFTRKHLDSDLCEIRAATPPKAKKEKKKKNKNTAKDLEQERREDNERVLRSYRLK